MVKTVEWLLLAAHMLSVFVLFRLFFSLVDGPTWLDTDAIFTVRCFYR